jgi:putative oxidoreductase
MDDKSTVFRPNLFHDIAHFGSRLTLGSIFIAHSYGKFLAEFGGMLPQMGVPSEMQYPIALGEAISGILVISGVLSRIAACLLAIISLGAIFYIKKASYFVGQIGVEFDLLLLSVSLILIVAGPGRISISNLVKRIPRFLQ